MTTKEKINELINSLETTAETCEISTVAEIKNNLKSTISKLQAVEVETASRDTLLRQRIAELSNALGLVKDATEAAVGSLAYENEISKRIDMLLHVCPDELGGWKAYELRELNKMLAAAIEQSKQAVARLNAATDTLEAQKTATSDGNTRTPTNIDNALFLFRRISALKAKKAKFIGKMGAKWFNSTLADEYGNAISAALEEIEKLA